MAGLHGRFWSWLRLALIVTNLGTWSGCGYSAAPAPGPRQTAPVRIASVTLGTDEAGNAPNLGSDIDIGAGAKIIGGVTIGDNVRVGANAVVVHDALYLTSVLALIVAKLKNKPVVLIQHIAKIPFASSVKRHLMGLANLVVTQPMMHAADRLVFISSDVRRELLGEHSQQDSMLLFYGVDTSIFQPGSASGSDWLSASVTESLSKVRVFGHSAWRATPG